MAQLNPPRIRVGGLSKEVYVVTHGKEVKTVIEGKERVYLDATRKYKATDDFEDVAKELGWTPPAE